MGSSFAFYNKHKIRPEELAKPQEKVKRAKTEPKEIDLFSQPQHPLDNYAPLNFKGSDYKPNLDQKRLTGQAKRIHDLMKDGEFRTFDEIHEATGDPIASISAQLRHLSNGTICSFPLNKQHRGEPKNGLWEYQLIVNRD